MNRLKPKKLHITLLVGTNAGKLVLPRRYTLTHSDITGELFLSIGSEYNLKQISRLYTRLMRDEVLAELADEEDSLVLKVYCHISGGFVFGTARWRYNIFRSELPLALEALRYGDRALFEHNSELDNATVDVHMESSDKRFKKVENWGIISKYK
jgi:hypothetical protein